jgi:hypothetical protein
VRSLRYMGDDRSSAAVLRQGLERWPDAAQLLVLEPTGGASTR